jgi:hypothetical protein
MVSNYTKIYHQTMTELPEFIVESIDTSDETWKFFSGIQGLDGNRTRNSGIPKKFTSLATTSTIFRWKFGDQPGNPTIETTLNPYIHTFSRGGTYSVSHQSCYPCVATGTLVCSNGWCTKLIAVKELELGDSSLVALAGLAGLFIIIKEDNCCKLRDRCSEKRETCKSIKSEDTANIKECKVVEKLCTTRLKDCREKCDKAGHIWKTLPYTCLEKGGQHKEICQTIEQQKYLEKRGNTKNVNGSK